MWRLRVLQLITKHFTFMSPSDWNVISPSVSEYADTVHKGQDCVSVTVKEYDGLPWYVSPPVVVPAIDIVSNGEDFVVLLS